MNKRLLSLAIAMTTFACGAEQRHGDASSTASARREAAAGARPVRAWLPSLPLSQVAAADQRCAQVLNAELAIEGAVLKGVVLSDDVIADCLVMVSPNKRFFELRPDRDDECGSKIYTGELANSVGAGKITVRDHSGRTCPGGKPGTIEIDERDAVGRTREFAGSW